jgi:translocation and assembly module TamB
MALDATLNGRVKAPLAEGRSIDVLAAAAIKGNLAGTEARLQVAAELKPAEPAAEDPMEAKLQANIAPWLSQPVIDAKADLRNVDAASLWPGAPRTQLTGTVELQPDAATGPAAWQASANIRNAVPGPWDKGALPLEQVEARVGFDGTNWTIPEATLRAGGGRIEAEGRWSPAPAPWQARATVRGVRAGLLHSELSGAPISGTATARQREDAIGFELALRAEGGTGSKAMPGFGLDRVLAQGQWKDKVLDLRTLRLEAEGARVEGKLQVRVAEQAASGKLGLTLPGGSAQLEGRIAPAQGGATSRRASTMPTPYSAGSKPCPSCRTCSRARRPRVPRGSTPLGRAAGRPSSAGSQTPEHRPSAAPRNRASRPRSACRASTCACRRHRPMRRRPRFS